MRGFYRLLNYECAMMLKATLFISLGAILIPLVLIHQATKDYSMFTVHERYEDIYMSSGSVMIFFVSLGAIAALFIIRQYAGYWGGKSIYTFLTLPVRREVLYYSKLIAFMLCLLLLFAAQIIGMRLGYSLVEARSGSYSEGAFVMENGLFLSTIRSSFQRIILPLGFQELLSTISIVITVSTGLFFGVLCERSKRYWGFLPLGIAFILLFNTLSYRMNIYEYLYDNENLVLQSMMLLILSGLFIWQSIRLLRRGAIA